jgi:hypothetical protein
MESLSNYDSVTGLLYRDHYLIEEDEMGAADRRPGLLSI